MPHPESEFLFCSKCHKAYEEKEKAPETPAPAARKTVKCAKCGVEIGPSEAYHNYWNTFFCPDCFNFKPAVSSAKPESILAEADRIINGERRDAYGPVEQSFAKVAQGWSTIANAPITPRQVALMMVWLKVCRFNNKADRDSLVDIAGYAALAEKL